MRGCRDDPEQLETKSDDASEDDWETGGVGMDALHKAVTNNSHEVRVKRIGCLGESVVGIIKDYMVVLCHCAIRHHFH